MTVSTDSRTNPLHSLFSRLYTINWETVFYIVIFLLAVLTRFYGLGDRVMSHDESLHTRYSYNLYKDGNYEHTPLMHGPVLFHMTALSYFLFGDSDFSSRIYPAVLSIALTLFPFLFRRWIGRRGAMLASLMMLISPLLLYYGRYIRHDIPSIFYAMVMFYSILMYIDGPENRRRKPYWLYLFAAATVLNLGSKETAFIYIAIFGSFLGLYWLSRLIQYRFNLPGKTLFYFLIIGIALGGVAALGFYVVLDIIPFERAQEAAATAGGWFGSIDARSFIVWSLGVIVAVVTVGVGTFLWAFRDRLTSIPWVEIIIVLLIAVVICSGLIILEQLSHIENLQQEPSAPPVPGQDAGTETVNNIALAINFTPIALVWVVGVVLIGFGLFMKRAGWWDVLAKQFPEFDFIILTATLILPWLTAIVPWMMKIPSSDYIAFAESLPKVLYDLVPVGTPLLVGQFYIGFFVWLPLTITSVVLGLLWNWRRWLISAGIFYFIFAFFFTTVFTNVRGFATGMVYSLGYWLEQQGVRRGSQPQYYYLLIIMPMYEFLPILGSVLAMFGGLGVFWKFRKHSHQRREAAVQELFSDDAADDAIVPLAKPVGNRLEKLPFLLFIAWWAILNLVGYSLAGEKMPWLGTHLTTPMILLTAWYFGRIFDRINWAKFVNKGWLQLILLPFFFIALGFVIGSLLLGNPPFSGLRQDQLATTYTWLGALGLMMLLAYIIYGLVEKTGWAHLRQMVAVAVFAVFSVITFRSAFMASYINYDYATEFLVYAHAAPAIKQVLNQIEEISFRTTDGPDLRFAYDNLVSWPYSWYFRDFQNAIFVGGNPTLQQLQDAVVVVVGDGNRSKVEPILEDRYIRFDHMRLWWPMQDYFYLTPERVLNTFDFSPENPSAAMIRQGIFNIWWSRDYTTYGIATGKGADAFDPQNWPVSDRMHFYVRKDVAAQIWEYGVGEGTIANPLEDTQPSLCISNHITHTPIVTFDQSATILSRPLDLTLSDDGLVYVAEEFNYRISIFTTDGQYVGSFGQRGTVFDENRNWLGAMVNGGMFERPHSIAVGLNGNLYVADTWNYRIQVLSPDGEFITAWGQPREDGFQVQTVPVDGFWGPRDVEIDALGNVYVSDTGNKRVRVYDPAGTWLRDVGSGGSGLGQLDEPAGLAIHPDGRLFVADTWNRRVSVFSPSGEFLQVYNIRGWYEEQGNRPYLAIDAVRNLLYVTDPDRGRVLVLDMDGNCVGAFGQLILEGDPTGDQFRTVGGIAVDDDGFVYVVDAGAGRIVKFPPFPLPSTETSVNEQVPEVTPEVVNDAETTPEVTPEMTLEPEQTDAVSE